VRNVEKGTNDLEDTDQAAMSTSLKLLLLVSQFSHLNSISTLLQLVVDPDSSGETVSLLLAQNLLAPIQAQHVIEKEVQSQSQMPTSSSGVFYPISSPKYLVKMRMRA
jgi:hypothetical protein